jgi:hypothetical protein
MTKVAKLRWGFALILSIGTATSCFQQHKPSVTAIGICDMSASIVTDARQDCPKAIEAMVMSQQRGDSLTIIPVMGDAAIDAAGQIEHFSLPMKRALYDEDLRQLNQAAQAKLHSLAEQAVRHPSPKTDLLGSFQIAAQELNDAPAEHLRVIVALSDYIQDDQQFNFNTTPLLANRDSARKLATKLSHNSDYRLDNTVVLLGNLRSQDLSRLNHERRCAIQEFWMTYLRGLGAKPRWAIDGPGSVERFLQQQRDTRSR